ncbi:ribosomal large subunit pseudouridine synthase b [hydrocarbon metagenome]|uniref:Ribosomal large subunit pseudouridine synthase b n=1 Tax=hydrocarbon metagenome TaxID=938273 RepID=A0A0W8E8D3_9ZZZZ
MRLSKYLADAGVASRRKSEKLIADGKVQVNGAVVLEQGWVVNPDKDIVHVDGLHVTGQEKIYLLLNKPAGYLCSVYDPHGRPTVMDLVKDITGRLYPVGRLDMDTEGLLIMSNDGDFTNLMIHPRYHIDKKYRASVAGQINSDALKRLAQGVELEDGLTAPASIIVLEQEQKSTTIEIEIHEGRKRQVRRMCAAVGFPVISLKRTAFGFLTLGNIEVGQYRHLHTHEIEGLYKLASQATGY